MTVKEPTAPGVRVRAGKYLTFKLGPGHYGLEILKVREIIGLIGITAAPWPLADMMDELVGNPILARHVLQCMPSAKQKRSTHILVASPLKLDIVSRQLWIGEQEHRLTPKQSLLLEMFMRRPNETSTRRELMERVWDTAYLGDTRTLDVHIRWLREKIEETPGSPKLLVTVRGSGYCLTGA